MAVFASERRGTNEIAVRAGSRIPTGPGSCVPCQQTVCRQCIGIGPKRASSRTFAKAGEGLRRGERGDLLTDDPEVITHRARFQSSASTLAGLRQRGFVLGWRGRERCQVSWLGSMVLSRFRQAAAAEDRSIADQNGRCRHRWITESGTSQPVMEG